MRAVIVLMHELLLQPVVFQRRRLEAKINSHRLHLLLDVTPYHKDSGSDLDNSCFTLWSLIGDSDSPISLSTGCLSHCS